MSRSRSRRGLLAGIVVAVVLSACAGNPTGPVASVDGVDVPREQLEEWVRTATTANSSLDPLGLQAELLSYMIQTRIFEGLVAELGLTVDPALIDEVRDTIAAQVGGPLSLDATLVDIGFPRAFFDEVFLVQQASLDVIALQLSEGRSLETRTARHILVETLEEAEEVYELLLEGADFGDLARERSTDPGSALEGGLLGARERGVFVPPFDAAVWSAALDTVLEPVESDFGFHVIEVIAADTVSAAELDSFARQNLVFAELSVLIDEALRAAVITVDPTIGTWDADGGRIVPAGRSN